MEKMNRKAFIKKAGLLGITSFAGSTLLSSCGGGSETASSGMENQGPPQENSAEPMTEAVPPQQAEAQSVDCSEYNQNLTEADMNTRKALNYVKQTEIPEQNCKNCRFWQAEKFDGPCGGCQLISNGAVNPQGWCASWVAQPA